MQPHRVARALLEDVDLGGRVLTLDALHTTRDTARSIVEAHGADYVLSVKANCPDVRGGPFRPASGFSEDRSPPMHPAETRRPPDWAPVSLRGAAA